MAEFYGEGGTVTQGAWSGVLNVTKWTLNISSELFDVTKLSNTPIDTAAYKEFKQGHIEWAGSIEGFLDDATNFAMDQFGHTRNATSITLEDGHSNTYVGTILLSDISIENDREDYVRYTANFQGSSTLTVTVA